MQIYQTRKVTVGKFELHGGRRLEVNILTNVNNVCKLRTILHAKTSQ
jgi:hypothetical protein